MIARHRKILLSLLLIGVTSVLAGFGTFSAFSSTTTNIGQLVCRGHRVRRRQRRRLGDVHRFSNQAPLASTVALHQGHLRRHAWPLASGCTPRRPIGAVGDYVNLTVEKGTRQPDLPELRGVQRRVDASTPASSTTSPSTHGSYANGVAAFPGAQTQWNQNDTLVYRFTLTLQDDNNANGGATPLSSGSHAFTWEARNQ